MREEIKKMLSELNLNIEKMVHDDNLTIEQKQDININLLNKVVTDLYDLLKRKDLK